MTLDEILASLFPDGHVVVERDGVLTGRGTLRGTAIEVIGVARRTAVGIDEAIRLSAHVLATIRRGGSVPILVLVDSDSQRMSKRDELLGLNEFLSHLAKCLMHADALGHPTVGLLYGHTAAGAFLATALATRTLIALPGANPEVMDLASMARVTKISVETLREKAASTPVFAPGLDNLAQTGAVHATFDPTRSLAAQLESLLGGLTDRTDRRDWLGHERHGRPAAAPIAQRVYELARASC
ncbi:MAG: biotin-independent malonate decarboxylase subunit gamma [Paraburkholderia sp.]|nr:biotin-independent malonate decarboxylase subunit gamma [Paraburkholderia sp.]